MVDIQASLAMSLDGIKKSVDELHQTQIEQFRELERYRGEKIQRLPVIQATATGGQPFTMGGDVGQELSAPEQGFVWSLSALTIEGMARGATPDIIQVRRGSVTGQVIWELNGNQYCQTWGKGQVIIYAGETLFYTSVGNISTTTTIKAYGAARQVPGPKIGTFI